jgi:hypothetical protein
VEVLLVLAVLVVVAWLVLTPLRRGASVAAVDAEASARDELEARKEAKYREIRDAEMDLRTGKLSQDDHRILDRQLRAEAIEVLRALDEAAGR